MILWVEAWELQCCGDPFAVGDKLHLSILTADEFNEGRPYGGYPVEEMSRDYGATITHFEQDRHSDTHGVISTHVVICKIEAITEKYVEVHPGSRRLRRVPGSVNKVRVDRAERFFPEPDDHQFEGYLVEFETL